jgi:2-polyprenyl-3-methyl-5-hydroxy-6-metoxy-1,4-benzoquinol methylase
MFDWVSISSDPTSNEGDAGWKAFYDRVVTQFILRCPDARDQRILRLITEFGHNILDVGFAEHSIARARSDGWFHWKLRSVPGVKVCGLDLNAGLVEQIRSEFSLDGLYSGDATDSQLVVNGGGFDVIHAGDLIEHLSNCEGFFAFCRNNLKPGGHVVLTTPNPCSAPRIIRLVRFGGAVANFEHVSWITPTNINELCRRYGFEFVSSIYAVCNPIKSALLKACSPLAFRLRDFYFDEFCYVIQRRE